MIGKRQNIDMKERMCCPYGRNEAHAGSDTGSSQKQRRELRGFCTCDGEEDDHGYGVALKEKPVSAAAVLDERYDRYDGSRDPDTQHSYSEAHHDDPAAARRLRGERAVETGETGKCQP